MQYLASNWTDPAMNLALEQYVFDTLAQDDDFFMLWRNNNAVIICLHQNTADEVNLSYAEQNDIKIVRRLSGGGAVFHDLGNLNFTFVINAQSAETLDSGRLTQQIADALSNLGVHTQLSGRNDITIDGCKFSGTASYFRGNRLMHHGTLLFDTDIEKMSNVLSVSDDKIISKGVASVRNRVTNVRHHLQCSITMDEFWAYLHERIAYDMQTYTLTEQDIAAVEVISHERYASWEWNFGRAPGYSIVKKRRIPGFGGIRVCMDVIDGKISAFHTYGDYFGDKPCGDVATALDGVSLTQDALRSALSGIDLDEYYRDLAIEEFIMLVIS